MLYVYTLYFGLDVLWTDLTSHFLQRYINEDKS